MEILGIGIPELVFIFIVALIIMGPKDMQKAGKTIGKWLRKVVTSDGWKIFQQTSREIRTLPNRLIREANEELTEPLNQIGRDINDPLKTLDRKYPAPAHSQPVGGSPAPKEQAANPSAESDPEKDA